MKKALIPTSFVLWLLGSPWARAAVVQYNLEQMCQKSKLIVTGEVVEITCYTSQFLDLGEVMFTDVKIRVEKAIKGSLLQGGAAPEGKEITIQVLGGQIGTAFQRCPDSPQYEKGEKVLLFLREWNGRLWNTGWHQGKYQLGQNGAMVSGKEHLPIAGDVPLAAVEDQVRRYTAREIPAETTPKPGSGTSVKEGSR